jgi:hypothetical protein
LIFFSTLLGGPIVTQKTLPIQSSGPVNQGYGAMPLIQKVHHHRHHGQKSLPVSSYGQVSQGYGGVPLIPQLDQQQQQLPVQSYGQVSQGYGGVPLIRQLDQQQQPVPQVPVLTPAGKILNFFYLRKFYLNFF